MPSVRTKIISVSPVECLDLLLHLILPGLQLDEVDWADGFPGVSFLESHPGLDPGQEVLVLFLCLDDFLIRKRNFLNRISCLQVGSRNHELIESSARDEGYYLSKETSSSVMLVLIDSCIASSIPVRGSEVLTGDRADWSNVEIFLR